MSHSWVVDHHSEACVCGIQHKLDLVSAETWVSRLAGRVPMSLPSRALVDV